MRRRLSRHYPCRLILDVRSTTARQCGERSQATVAIWVFCDDNVETTYHLSINPCTVGTCRVLLVVHGTTPCPKSQRRMEYVSEDPFLLTLPRRSLVVVSNSSPSQPPGGKIPTQASDSLVRRIQMSGLFAELAHSHNPNFPLQSSSPPIQRYTIFESIPAFPSC